MSGNIESSNFKLWEFTNLNVSRERISHLQDTLFFDVCMKNGEPNKLKMMFSVIGWTYQNKTDPNFAISIASTYGILTYYCKLLLIYHKLSTKFW